MDQGLRVVNMGIILPHVPLRRPTCVILGMHKPEAHGCPESLLPMMNLSQGWYEFLRKRKGWGKMTRTGFMKS